MNTSNFDPERHTPKDEELGSEPESIEQRRLQWDDLLFFEVQTLGLRHIPHKEEADTEMREGFEGDVLALGNGRSLIPEEMVPDHIRQVAEKYKKTLTLASLDSVLSKEQKGEIASRLQSAVSAFIKANLELDSAGLSVTEQDQAKKLMEDGHSYLLITGSGEHPYDISEYYGLGKAGRKEYSPDDVLGVVRADEILQMLEDTEEQKRDEEKLIDITVRLILKRAREARQ